MEKTVRRNIVLALASATFALVLVGLVGEWAVRNRERTRETVPGTSPGMIYPHTRYRFGLTRGFEYYTWTKINDQGFRGAPLELLKAPGTIRVMVVGASTVYDTAVSPNDRAWPARLEVWLEQLSGGRDFEVINAGTPGMVLLDNLIRLQFELHKYDPDLLILYQAHNDLIATLFRLRDEQEGVTQPSRVAATTPWGNWIERNSLLLPKLIVRWQSMMRRRQTAGMRSTSTPDEYEASIGRGVERHSDDLRSFLAIADAFDIDVVIPETTYLGAGVPIDQDPGVHDRWLRALGIPAEHVISGYDRFEEATTRITAEAGVPYVPLRGLGTEAPELYADEDPIHFNEAGSDLMAQIIARWLVDNGVFSESVPGQLDGDRPTG